LQNEFLRARDFRQRDGAARRFADGTSNRFARRASALHCRNIFIVDLHCCGNVSANVSTNVMAEPFRKFVD
jgi:hypothetical protein